jgi:hypothetical protein
MVSTYTDNLGFNKQGDNDNPDSWGDILNEEVIALIEESITGRSAASKIDLNGEITDRFIEILNGAASDVNGTGTNKARCAILETEGALGNDISLNLPTIYKTYVFFGGHTNGIVSLTHSGTTDTVELNEDDVAFIYTTPTSIRLIAGTAGTGGGGDSLLADNNLSDLTDTVQAILNLGIYPVGATYTTMTNTDPGTFLGGTWQQIAAGRVLIGAGTSTNDDNGESRTFAPGDLGGTFAEALTIDQLPEHTHDLIVGRTSGSGTTGGTHARRGNGADRTLTTEPAGNSGAGSEINNLQPYLAVYFWERIA